MFDVVAIGNLSVYMDYTEQKIKTNRKSIKITTVKNVRMFNGCK